MHLEPIFFVYSKYSKTFSPQTLHNSLTTLYVLLKRLHIKLYFKKIIIKFIQFKTHVNHFQDYISLLFFFITTKFTNTNHENFITFFLLN